MNGANFDSPNGIKHGWTFNPLIQIPKFEISWAGEHPLGEDFLFGSDDGRLTSLTREGRLAMPPSLWIPSREAINGIASSGSTIAASSRQEVVFVTNPSIPSGGTTTIYPGGAHGICATSFGGFVAPLGVGGLLTMTVSPDREQPLSVFALEDKKINLYKITNVFGDGSKDLFVSAVRGNGLQVLEINQRGPTTSRTSNAPGLDIIDVCSLSSPEWPRAAAGLGIDRSVHLWRDILGSRPPHAIHFEALGGVAYKILHSQGHLLILTSTSLFAFPLLITRYLNGEYTGGVTQVRRFPMNAVDLYLVYDKVIAVMGNGSAAVLSLDTLSGMSDISDASSTSETCTVLDIPWETTTNSAWAAPILL